MLRPGMTLGMAIVLLMGGAPVPAPASDPFAFILSARAIAPADRARLDAGDTLIKVLPANNPELAVFGATRIDVDADRLLAWARQVEELYKGPYMPVIRRFSSPPHHDDLAAFTLSDKDLADIRTCRLGNCGVKLSGPEIERLQQATAVAGADWKSATQRAFRDI